jgi:hypothetical protein
VIRTKDNPRLDKLLLLAIFAVLSVSTITWNLADKTPPPWDPSDHISAAYDYYRALANADPGGFAEEFVGSPRFYAPLVHLGSALFFLGLGASRVAAILINLVSLGALLISVDWIGRRLFSSRLAVLAALLASCYHFAAWLLHDAFLDYPLIAIVSVSVALLIRADDFTSIRRAIAFGVVAGLGMLTKQTYPFFLLAPSLYVAFRVIRGRNRSGIINLVLACFAAAAVAAIWYVPHFKDVIDIYNVNRLAARSENEAPLFSFASNVYYLFGLISPQMQIPLAILFVAGLVYSLRHRRKECAILHLWLAGGLFCFSLIANKDLRYTAPVLPAAALISISWLAQSRLALKYQNAKRAVVIVTALWALASFFNAQWPRPGMGWHIDSPRFRWMVFARNYFTLDHRPLDDDWSVPQIVSTVAELAPSRKTASVRDPAPAETVSPPTNSIAADDLPRLGVVVNLPYLNPSSVALYARLMARERAGPPLIMIEWLVAESTLDRLGDCDYILVRTGLDQAEWVAPVERTVEAMIKSAPERFEKAASFPVPLKAAEAVVYRVR